MWKTKLRKDDIEQVDKLKELRSRIDAIDEQMLNLLNARANLALDVAKVKKEHNLDFYNPKREREIIETLQKMNKGPFPNCALRVIFKEIFCASLALEQPRTVAYLGPQATYTHQAALKYFSSSCKFLPTKSIREVFEKVDADVASFGVVPIENSNEGAINYTLDMFMDFNLKVYAELLLSICHNLLSKVRDKSEITKVYSHPQALAQCRDWLERNMLGVPIYDSASTAQAASMAAEEFGSAAIGSELAGKMYDLNFIERNIENIKDNVTRFLIISKESQDRSGHDKTLMMFSVKDEPGALYEILTPFKKQKINMTKIESRPTKRKAWDYVFFADVEGHIEDKKVKKALDAIKKRSVLLKILGSYPQVDQIEK
ncbi:chorismate mutase and prephenate dehydratase [Candidatus Magnetobacterium bavaricum]|uniref:Bifunctional chorismate mutase/prephenate dehydratase n=1 Tax=Candidatus Magnetobacterium bavaricum TaxID=29290 RepID=A0A0F3GLN4_9BACT|nr:chorismate mutase and prephenate dehydratase [Candidatus Magnetobacterium bavaricum]